MAQARPAHARSSRCPELDPGRRPVGVDPSVGQAVSAEVVLLRIQAAASANWGSKPLLRRSWVAAAGLAAAASTGPSSAVHLRVMQFNLLAQGLSAPPGGPTPYATDLKGRPYTESAFGGFSAVPHPEHVFDFDAWRRWRLLEEILRCEPDLVCVEELDRFDDFFAPALAKFGFDGVFVPKCGAPSCNYGFYSDGVAIFWNSALLRPVPELISRAQVPGPAVVMGMEHIPSGERFVVAGTHLKAKPGPENESRRLVQVEALLDRVEEVERRMPAGTSSRCLVLGDFNTEPESNEHHEALAVPAVLHWQDSRLRSAYSLEPSGEFALGFSTRKQRGAHCVQHLIDYIFHDHGFVVDRVLGPVNETELEPQGLPAANYPSDHISLAADLTFL